MPDRVPTLAEARRALGLSQRQVAQALGVHQRTIFGGSPSFLVRGRDLFAGPVTPLGLTCRLYPTPDGLAGAPTVEQLVHALEWALIE